MTDTIDPNALRLPAFLRAVPGTLMARVIAGRTEDNLHYGRPLLAMLAEDVEPIPLTPDIDILADMLVDVVLSYDLEGYRHWWKVAEPLAEQHERVATILLPNIRRIMPNLIAQYIIGVHPMTGSTGHIHTLRVRYADEEVGKLRISRETGNLDIHTGYGWTTMGSTDRRRLWANIRLKLANLVESPFDSEMARLAERTFLSVVKQIMPKAVHHEACEEFKREMEVVE